MRLRATADTPTTVAADVLAVPIYRDETDLAGELAELDAASGGALRHAIEWGEFNILEHPSALVDAGDLPGVEHLLLLNAGTRGRGAFRARRLASVATRRLNGRGARTLAIWLRDGEDDDAWAAAAAGAAAGTYRSTAVYGRVRDTDAMLRSVDEVLFLGASQAAIDRGAMVGEGIAFGRDLANRSANDLYPERMAEIARELEADGCTVEVLEPSDMERLGMGLLLGVGQGAAHAPRLIAIKLPGWERGGDRRLAIVGKGVCFDSGGISIKPSENMGDMKHDKSGAAAVVAAARTLARLAPDAPVMAVAPMVENMPGGNAQRPGDVVKAMNGMTVEVTNTDAEGRLILADAMTWAEREGATHVVDVATLTGACAVAFGDQVSAYFAKPRDWGEWIGAAAEKAGEWFWEMPLVPEYRASYDSPHADIVNSGTRDGSLIKAAIFLSEFVTVPWVHVDIAGTAYLTAERPYGPKGATGSAVAALVQLGLDFAAEPPE
ncbi:MAG TPA: M17 family peptidase N-terminal domain-containing protein [Candidatus Limnocylindria bacterium]|nr:M17 family peptidase N-terminal domain-containing protein [Candidatus Limnocylindria bacterium]